MMAEYRPSVVVLESKRAVGTQECFATCSRSPPGKTMIEWPFFITRSATALEASTGSMKVVGGAVVVVARGGEGW